jgi:transcriptional regulator with XRE-family HTH domain
MSRKKFITGLFLGDLSYRIKNIRKEKGLTQAEFGALMGVRQGTINKYESGRIPDLSILKKIADYGGVTVEWLLHGEKAGPPQLREAAPEALAARPRPLNEAALADIIFRVRDFANRRRLSLDLKTEARLISSLYIGIYEADLRLPDDREIEANLNILLPP